MNEVATVATACGPFTVLVSGSVVIASGWTTDLELLVAPMRPPPLRHESAVGTDGAAAVRACGAVAAYFAGQVGAIDDTAVGQRSGPFVEAVWRELRALPPGAPVSYQELAARAGRPGAARAAGWACQANAVALFVPCHRARRGDGSLGGFRWGLEIKRWLLDHEAGGARRV